MTPEERARCIEEINREIEEIAQKKQPTSPVSDREATLKRDLTRLKQEAQAGSLLDLPIMDPAVLRGSKRPTGGVPTMITIAMRAKLQTLGYRDEQIDKLTPAEAWKILGRPGAK